MYLMFVDESGDTGTKPGASPYYVLTGLVLHETRYHEFSRQLAHFRQALVSTYGFPFTTEIHATKFCLSPRGPIARIQPWRRLQLLRDVLDFQAAIPDLRILSVVVNKSGKPSTYNVHGSAWTILLQRFHNTITYGNFPHATGTDSGLVCIDGDGYYMQIRRLMTRLKQTNPIRLRHSGLPGDVPITRIIDDPVIRKSEQSRLIQLADVNSWWLWQSLCPNHHVRTLGGRRNFERLAPICCKEACRSHPLGTVWL